MIWAYAAGAAILGFLGFNQYKKVKVGDQVKGRNIKLGADVPGLPGDNPFEAKEGIVKVLSLEGDRVLGTFIFNGTDTNAPAMLLQSDVIDNLTPHL